MCCELNDKHNSQSKYKKREIEQILIRNVLKNKEIADNYPFPYNMLSYYAQKMLFFYA